MFNEWYCVQEALSVEDSVFVETIRKYIILAESSKHIYAMAGVLHEKVRKIGFLFRLICLK